MTMADFPTSEKYNVMQKKILASYDKAEAKHKDVMAGITASENATFKKLNDALTASREVDAKNKDKLGNTMPPSQQTEYLQGQLMNHMANQSQKSQKLTPPGAGITPQQVQEGDFAGWGGRNTPDAPIQPFGPRGGPQTTPQGPVGDPAQGSPEVFPMDTKVKHKSGVSITLTGQQRMGPEGPEYMAKNEKGQTAWVPRGSFQTTEEAESGGMQTLLNYYKPKFAGEDPDAFNVGG
jgi:hypothetical protein